MSSATGCRDHNHVEQVWAILREVLEVQQNNDPANNISNLRGFPEDGYNSFAAVTLLLLLSNPTLRNQIQKSPPHHILNVMINNYWANRLQDLREFMLFAGHEYTFATNNNITMPNFLQSILNKSNQIYDIVSFKGVYIKTCIVCSCKYVQEFQSNILRVPIKNDSKITYELKTLMDFERSIKKTWTTCLSWNKDTTHNVQVYPKITNKILIIQLQLENSYNSNPEDYIFCNYKIKALPTSVLKIHNRSYKLHSCIFYENNLKYGRYKTNWVQIKNQITKIQKWQQNSKNAHILVFEVK